MNYYIKLFICLILFFICYMIIRNISTSTKEHFITFGNYSFDKYYGNYRKDYGYTDNNYKYPVFYDKNYKNFTSSKYNYNDVYDAYYKNTQTKN